jgi:hypothetical protein
MDVLVDVRFQPSSPADRDTIVVELLLPPELSRDDCEAARQAVWGGGVVSRLALGSKIEIHVTSDATTGECDRA